MALSVPAGRAGLWLIHPSGTFLWSQLKSFGAKLKERNNIFRRTSKVHSHQMKEALYSHLLQAQQVGAVCWPWRRRLRGGGEAYGPFCVFRQRSGA